MCDVLYGIIWCPFQPMVDRLQKALKTFLNLLEHTLFETSNQYESLHNSSSTESIINFGLIFPQATSSLSEQKITMQPSQMKIPVMNCQSVTGKLPQLEHLSEYTNSGIIMCTESCLRDHHHSNRKASKYFARDVKLSKKESLIVRSIMNAMSGAVVVDVCECNLGVINEGGNVFLEAQPDNVYHKSSRHDQGSLHRPGFFR